MKIENLELYKECLEGLRRVYEIVGVREENGKCFFQIGFNEDFGGGFDEFEVLAKNLLEETGIEVFAEVLGVEEEKYSFKFLNKYRDLLIGFRRIYILEHLYFDEENDEIKFVIIEQDYNDFFRYHRNYKGVIEKKWWNFHVEEKIRFIDEEEAERESK